MIRTSEYQHRLIGLARNIALETSVFSSEDIIDRVLAGFSGPEIEDAVAKHLKKLEYHG